MRLGGVLGGGEVAAFVQARLQRLEVVGRDDAERDFIVLSMNGAANDNEAGGEVSVADGKLVGDGSGGHAGERSDAIEYLALEGNRFLIVGVLGARHGKRKRDEIVRHEAGIDLQQAIEALAQQPRTDQKNDGGGQFDDDQVGSELAPDGS